MDEDRRDRRILSAAEDLKNQKEAVWDQYVLASSSERALRLDYPSAASKRAVEAELLRAAAMSLEILRLNSEWIESGLQARLIDRRQREVEDRAAREARRLR